MNKNKTRAPSIRQHEIGSRLHFQLLPHLLEIEFGTLSTESQSEMTQNINSYKLFKEPLSVLIKKGLWVIAWIASIIISIMLYRYFFFYRFKQNQTPDIEADVPRILLGEACNSAGCECVTVKFNQDFISFSPGFHTDRIYDVVRMAYEGYSKIQPQLLPGDHIVAFPTTDFDYPFKYGTPPPGVRMYWPATANEHLNNTAPDFAYFNWVSADIYFFDATVNELRENCKKPFVVDKLFWRGADVTASRATLVNLGRLHSDLIDAAYIKWKGTNHDVGAKFVKLEDHYFYSMLIDVEGSGYSARLKYLVHANRTLFIQERRYWDWALRDLEPFTHYIPVKHDFSDLINQIKWAKEHPEEVQEMNNRRIEYADKYIRFQNAIDRFGEIFLEN